MKEEGDSERKEKWEVEKSKVGAFLGYLPTRRLHWWGRGRRYVLDGVLMAKLRMAEGKKKFPKE
jgi:hypothetical protein